MRHGDNPNNFRVNPGMILASIETSFLPIKQHLQPFCAGKRTCPVESAGAEESGRKERAGISGHNRVADPFSQTALSPSARRRAVKMSVEEGIGKVAAACRALGLARSSYYRGGRSGHVSFSSRSMIGSPVLIILHSSANAPPACSLENKSRSVKPISSDGSFLP
jgi:hypothetical protein